MEFVAVNLASNMTEGNVLVSERHWIIKHDLLSALDLENLFNN
jgi:hypothetical protein